MQEAPSQNANPIGSKEPEERLCYGEELRKSVPVAVACALVVFGWQAFTVHFNYAGNWTGLFCIGDRMPQPPALDETTWRFPDSPGYDGQWYHLVAHDPWRQRGFDRFLDNPRVRYSRILVPALAHLLAAGSDRYLHPAYAAVILMSILMGTCWLSRYAVHHGSNPWLGAGFLLVPAVLVSIDRWTVDVALACLCVGFVWFRETRPGAPLYATLLAATLVRETGLALLAGYVAELLVERRFRRAALFGTAALPAAAWYCFLALDTANQRVPILGVWPMAGYLHRLLHPEVYPSAMPVASAATLLDYTALAGVAWALVLTAQLAMAKPRSPHAIPIVVFALLTVFLDQAEVWTAVYAFGRVLTPLLLLAALYGLGRRRWRLALPMAMVTPRIALQFGPQALQAFREMAR